MGVAVVVGSSIRNVGNVSWLPRAGRRERPAVRGKGMRKMSRKGIPVLFIVSLLCLLAAACADNDAVRTNAGTGPAPDDSEQLDGELEKSSEVWELIAIRDELAARAIARNVTPEQIREAGYDIERSNELLGLTEAERRARFERIDALLNSLYARYPALKDAAAREAAASKTCGIECAASRWERYSQVLSVERSADGSPALRAPARPPLKCNWKVVVAGIAACATASGGSGILYLICSYGVVCDSCTGGITEVIC